MQAGRFKTWEQSIASNLAYGVSTNTPLCLFGRWDIIPEVVLIASSPQARLRNKGECRRGPIERRCRRRLVRRITRCSCAFCHDFQLRIVHLHEAPVCELLDCLVDKPKNPRVVAVRRWSQIHPGWWWFLPPLPLKAAWYVCNLRPTQQIDGTCPAASGLWDQSTPSPRSLRRGGC